MKTTRRNNRLDSAIRQESASPTIYSIGHSTRRIESFIQILKSHEITLLVDVRTVPRSRRNLQFNSDVLKAFLEKEGIEYSHLKSLGGLRHPRPDSTNTAWRNASFRGYADHMETAEFEKGIRELILLGEERKGVVIMCAEGNPFRCHRVLLSDALFVRGVPVIHITSRRPGRIHKLTPFAHVEGHRLSYPDVNDELLSKPNVLGE